MRGLGNMQGSLQVNPVLLVQISYSVLFKELLKSNPARVVVTSCIMEKGQLRKPAFSSIGPSDFKNLIRERFTQFEFIGVIAVSVVL